MKTNKIIAIALAASALAACGQVKSGHTGVFTRYGAVDKSPAREGLHWYNPLTTDLIVMDTQVQRGEGTASTYTRDTQLADIKYVINYQLNPNSAPSMYRAYGEDWFNRIAPQVVVASIKDEFGKWNAVQAIERREELQRRVAARIIPGLSKRNIIVHGFEITDISYSKAFEAAVEAKQVAVERANAERNRTVQVEEQAKQRIVAAKGEAEAMSLRAQALEKNPKLVQYQAIEKWDGKLPVNMYGGSAVPFVDVSKQ
jgi:regulator of protease activity HflC (stomatin/prohibitin superfamily)